MTEGPTEFGMTRIQIVTSIRERAEGAPVELWREDNTGKVFVRAYNECHNNYTDVELAALVALGKIEE